MLSLFPGLLFLAPFSATILRVGAGLSFIYIGCALIVRRDSIKGIDFPMVHYMSSWLIIVAGGMTLLDGFAILVGFGTQLAAIIGMLISLKHVLLSRRFDGVQTLARSTNILLFLMCLSLLITGAGPFGFDLPL
ncbi:MAG TPA: hypothetical protein VMU27_02335 [Candidatus Paceibacterota bacterium]|nr:hypothetical protein [Candidatus Paceibacterota bacterium]